MHIRRLVGWVVLVAAVAGCSAKSEEKIDEGHAAAQNAALAEAVKSQTTPSSIPSLDRTESSYQIPMNAPPPTAPPPDKFDNKDPAHLLARCRDRGARHEWFDAIGDCRKSYELDPSSIEPQVELMHLLIDLQSFGDAEEAAKKVLAVRPNDSVALYYLAWSYRGRDKFPQAITALQKAVALDPKRLEYVQALALTYRLAGNYGKSLETLEKALELDPKNEKTKAMVVQARDELSEKLAPYRKLVRDEPDSFDNQAALGFMFQKYGLLQKALPTYDTALSMIPTPVEKQSSETKKLAAQIHYNRGVVYRELGKPDQAEPALWQSMQLDPSLSSYAWYYIGLSRYDAGKYEPSIEALRKSVDLAPGVADNRSALADAYQKMGKSDLATEQRNAVAAIRAREDDAKEQFRKEESDGVARAEKAAADATAAATPAPAAAPEAASASPKPAAPAAPEPALDPSAEDDGEN